MEGYMGMGAVSGHGEILKILTKLGGDVIVVDNKTPMREQVRFFEQFIKWANRMREGECDGEPQTVHQKYAKLLKEEVPLDEKVELLAYLAACGNVESVKVLEAYQEKVSPELKEWAKLAMSCCQTVLKGELTGQKQVFVTTGLGGSINRFRFCVCLFAAKGVTFAPFQRETIEKEMRFMMGKVVEFERLVIKDRYAIAMVLVPIQENISRLVEETLNSINVYGNFLHTRPIISNTMEVTEEHCLKYLREEVDV